MKRLGIGVAIALAVALVACGGNVSSMKGSSSFTTTNPATGSWSVTLASSSGQQLGSFTFNMTQNNTMLTGSNMNFAAMMPLAQCFGTGTEMNGQTGSGMMNGGTITMAMSFTPPGSMATNTMTMQGTMATGMGSGSGTFVLLGQTLGCTTQTGTFTMTHTSTL